MGIGQLLRVKQPPYALFTKALNILSLWRKVFYILKVILRLLPVQKQLITIFVHFYHRLKRSVESDYTISDFLQRYFKLISYRGT